MAEYRFDCRKCTNSAYSLKYGLYYCLPTIMGESTIELHDMGGTKAGDYLTCDKYTTEPRDLVIYEAVSIYNAEHPCEEWKGDI